MLLLNALSRSSHCQWPSWTCVRLLASHVVVSAEAAKAVSQHGQGLVKLPGDMQQTLEGYLQDVGLSGKVSKQQVVALTEKLKALGKSTVVGGLQPYGQSSSSGDLAHWQQHTQGDAAMTAEQLQEQQEMDQEYEKLAAAYGPEELARYQATRVAAASAAKIPLARTKGGRLKSSTRDALEKHIEQYGLLSLPHEAVRAAFDLPPSSSLMSESRQETLKAVTPKYDQTQALAYAVARLPSCFAASHRIFKELAVRFPGFEPKTMLDFGAGPGTAVWAAQEVWPASLSRVIAVEPSHAMSQLGRRLEAARRFAHPHAPLVRWRPDMPPVARSARKKSQQQTYNIVVASYVLGEVPSPQERATLLRKLWSVTNDMLVIIEPGTPSGFSNVLEARTSILDHEGRRAAKLQKRLAAAANDEPATQHSGSSGGDAALAAKADSKWFGAHVVAPCPHDSACPLAVPGRKSWCHFGTRFQRPGFLQQAKAPAGARMNAADHQDELHSYVVLRRGTRPPDAPRVDIRRSFAPKAAASMRVAAAPAASAPLSESHGQERRTLFPAAAAAGSTQSVFAAASASSGSGADDMQRRQQQQQQEQEQEQYDGACAAASDADSQAMFNAAAQEHAAGDASLLFSADELQQLSSLLPGSADQQHQQPQDTAAAVQSIFRPGQYAKLGPYGPGLIDRLMALEDAGVDWTASGTDALKLEELDSATQLAGGLSPSSGSAAPWRNGVSASAASSQHLASSESSSGSDADTDADESSSGSDTDTDADDSSSGSDTDAQLTLQASWQQQQQQSTLSDGETEGLYTSGSDSDTEHEDEDWEEEEAVLEGLKEAASSSSDWSRIIRPPRKRGGHVVLDVCTARCPDSSSSSSSSSSSAQAHGAAIVRHVVARSDAHKWMGRAGYEMARSAHWGDLWPSAYDANDKQQVVSSTERP